MINFRHLAGLGLSFATIVLVCACDKVTTTPSGPYTLSGVVTQMTSSGKVPIRGVFVEESNIHRQAVTDDSGRFRLAAMPAGVATIQVSMLRFESESRSVTISGDTTVDVELLQREQFILSGFVTEETPAGRVPVAGVLVQIDVCPPQPVRFRSLEEAETDTNGFYSVLGMCGGETTLYARKLGYELLPPSGRPCEDHGEPCGRVTIAGNTRLDFSMSRR
jgi:hypothetical protein